MAPHPVDVTAFLATLEKARHAKDTAGLLQLCGLLGTLLTMCRESARVCLDGQHKMAPAERDDELTASQMAEATQMSAAYFYRNAHRLPYAVRHGRCVRFSWSGYLRCRERDGKNSVLVG